MGKRLDDSHHGQPSHQPLIALEIDDPILLGAAHQLTVGGTTGAFHQNLSNRSHFRQALTDRDLGLKRLELAQAMRLGLDRKSVV